MSVQDGLTRRPMGSVIRVGSEYNSRKDPDGGVYRVDGFILDIPAYQEKILVRCISGVDKGLWFSCSPANFVTRFIQRNSALVP